MGNPFGRATIVPLTNKSGGSVAAGDFVYIDTANNDSFTTGTTSGYTKGIGIAQAAIASNAVGLVLVDGYASLVNVNASVTRGNFLKGHSVVKQGTDAGSSRAAGTCGMFLTGGTTPDALIWQPDLGAGSGELVATSAIWTAKGQIAAATGSGAASALAVGTNGSIILADSSQTTGLGYTERPELIDLSTSGGSNVAFTSPTSDDASLTFLTDQSGVAKVVQCTDVATRRHAYVSSAVGTGDFDYRMRIVAHGITVPHSSSSAPLLALFVADSSLTPSTRLSLQVQALQGGAAAAATPYALGVAGTAGAGNLVSGSWIRPPLILRIKRVGTAVTFYVSTDEGRIWQQCGSATSSLNVGRVGLLMQGGSTGTQTAVVIVHWLRSF